MSKDKISAAALIPFGVFMLFYLGLSIWNNNFYSTPMPIAFLVASASAMLFDRRKKLMEKVEIYASGMGDKDIMIMCLIFILAGAFASTAQGMGAVDSTVLIARKFIPGELMLAGFFFISCFISLAIGTSCGTIAALTPIAAGLLTGGNGDPALLLGAVVGGAMFGDNLSMISDTTIAAARTQNVAMKEKFFQNIKIALPAALIAVIFYFFLGKNSAFVPGELPEISSMDIIRTLPYLVILIGALCGLNVMFLLFGGTLLAMIIGIAGNTFTFQEALGEAGSGITGMSETLIVAILAGGLLAMIRHNGGITFMLEKITAAIRGKRGCEAGIMLLVSAVNLFTANNTVAIVIAGPVARELSDKFHCDRKRIASILDSGSCVIQGIIPYGAQLLIAVGVAGELGVEITPPQIIAKLYYPMLLGVMLIISIAFSGKGKSPAKQR
jgi:Na+/H+ antiporter NhaC